MLPETHLCCPHHLQGTVQLPSQDLELFTILCPAHLSPHPGLHFHFSHSKRGSSLPSLPPPRCASVFQLRCFCFASWNTIPSPVCLLTSLSTLRKLKHPPLPGSLPQAPMLVAMCVPFFCSPTLSYYVELICLRAWFTG